MIRATAAVLICMTLAALADQDPAQSPGAPVPGTVSTAPAPGSAPAPGAQSQSQPHASIDDRLLARLAEIDQRIEKVVDLRAEFTQTRHTPLLKKPLVSTGALLVMGNRVRWDTKEPRPSTMTIDQGEIQIYFPGARVMEIYSAAGDVRELTGSPLPRLPVLLKYFYIAELDPKGLGASAGNQAIAMELTPKTEDLQEHLKSVQVLMNTEIPAARKMIMTDVDGDRTEIEFKNVRLNTGMQDSELDFEVPPGTRVSRPAGGEPSSQPAASKPAGERRP